MSVDYVKCVLWNSYIINHSRNHFPNDNLQTSTVICNSELVLLYWHGFRSINTAIKALSDGYLTEMGSRQLILITTLYSSSGFSEAKPLSSQKTVSDLKLRHIIYYSTVWSYGPIDQCFLYMSQTHFVFFLTWKYFAFKLHTAISIYMIYYSF